MTITENTVTAPVAKFDWIKVEGCFLADLSQLNIPLNTCPAEVKIDNPLTGRDMIFTDPTPFKQGYTVTKVIYTGPEKITLTLYNC
jgi:hypothetical protein